MTDAGKVVTRSFVPLPDRTVICFMFISMSCTRSRTASITLNPLPYSSLAINCGTPVMSGMTLATSSRVITIGTVSFLCARTALISWSNVLRRIFLYKKTALPVIRQCLGHSPLPPEKVQESVRQIMLRLTGIDIALCPRCKKGLMVEITQHIRTPRLNPCRCRSP